MTATQETQTTYSVRRFFAGKSVLVTGSTGFLAKALVEKILRDLPEVARVFLLIRPRARPNGELVDPRERLREEILRNSVFSRLRESMGEGFEAFIDEKIECVPGDLTHDNLGLDEAGYAQLIKDVDVVVGSAATVVFDERLDLALDINTVSPMRLLELAREAGAAYAHISTAYVSGMRKGRVPERLLDPIEAIDAQLPAGQPRPESFDVETEVEKLRALADQVKADCEAEQRTKGWDANSEEARTQLRRALVNAGMTRARSLGWNDTYTYTKFLGEQLVKKLHGNVPTIICRPSIIESSLREPEPGWLDGLRMADPLIVGFGKGRLADFPAARDMVLDVIPADFVVNAILAGTACIGDTPGAFDLIHVSSGSHNPLIFDNLYQSVRDYFKKYPFLDRAGKPVQVPTWKFPTVESFKRRLQYRYLHPMKALQGIVDGPVSLPGTRKLRSRLRSLNNAMEQLLYYVDIYSPYTNLDCCFEADHAREILARIEAGERDTFDYDVTKIRWRHYIQDVHIPGLKRNILRMEEPPRAGAGEGHMLDEEAERTRQRASTAIHGVPQTIVELAARGADRFGNKTFLEIERKGAYAGRVRFSFREWFERAGDWARKLKARLDLQSGDRVVLWSENCPEWALGYLAIVRAGAVAVPLDRQMPVEEVKRIAQVVEAKAMMLSPMARNATGDALESGQGLPVQLNLLDDLEPFEGEAWTYPHAEWGDRPLKSPSPESLASILFTSGTTLAPRGVMLTHYNFVANALSVAEVLEPLESDRFLSLLPLHHAFEFTGGFLTPLFGGSTVYHLESLRPEEIQETMQKHQITVMLGVPRVFQIFADRIRERIRQSGPGGMLALSFLQGVAGAAEMIGGEQTRKSIFRKVHDSLGGKLRLFVSGGVGLPPDLFHFFKRFGINIAEGYGLTETGPILTANPLGAPRASSVGLPLPGVDLRIHRPDLQGVGEVLARGPNIMQGYWHDPEGTEKSFVEGWFRTGDLGRIDAEGFLYITGRVKEVIVSAAGKNVYPDELEPRFKGLPQVRDVCVVGLPARQGQGEEVALIVAARPNASRPAIEAAVENINRNLPSHQRVARVEFHPADLPKTSTLKIQRNKVRDFYIEQAATGAAPRPAAQKAAEAETRTVDQEVVRAIHEITGLPENEITPDKKLQLDLGLDSIARVDLISKLELRLGTTIPDAAMARMWTVGHVAEAVEAGALKAGAKPAGLAKRVWEHEEDPAWLNAMSPSFSKSVVQGTTKATSKLFFNVYLNIEPTGMQYLPTDSAYILAANHSSHLDTGAIREVLGARAANDLHVMGAKDYFFDTRLKSWFFTRAFNVLPFDRVDNTLDGLNLCRNVLTRGKSLLIFPEGTRSISGKLQPFKSGIGVLAVELDFPVIPVYVHGTYESLPKGRAVPRPARVIVRFGPPIDMAALKNRRADMEEGHETRKGRKGLAQLYREAAAHVRAGVEKLANQT